MRRKPDVKQFLVFILILIVILAIAVWGFNLFVPPPPVQPNTIIETEAVTVGGVKFEVEYRRNSNKYETRWGADNAFIVRLPDVFEYESGIPTINGIDFATPKPGATLRWNLEGPLLIDGQPQQPYPIQPKELKVSRVDFRWAARRDSPAPRDTLSVDWSGIGSLLATASGDGAIRIWQVDKPEVKQAILPPIPKEGAWGFRAVLSPDEKTVAAANLNSDEVTLWDTSNGNKIAAFLEPKGNVTGIDFAANNWLFEARDGTLFARNLDVGQTKATPIGAVHREFAAPFAIGGNGQFLAWNDGKTLSIAKLTLDGKSPSLFSPLASIANVTENAIFSFSTDGSKLALFDGKSHLSIHDSQTGQLKQPLRWRRRQNEQFTITAFAFYPDGGTLVVGDPFSMRIFDIESGRERGWSELPGVRSLAISSDGKTLAVGLRHLPGICTYATSDLVK